MSIRVRAQHTGIGFIIAMAVFLAHVSAAPEIGGHWVFSSQIPLGHDLAAVTLEDTGDGIEGRYFGLLGQDMAVKGSRSANGVTLVLSGEWPLDGAPIDVTLTGSLSDDSGSGT